MQAVLNLPELKVIKPSDTRWLSHEHCVNAILKELPALIITLQSIYDECGNAEQGFIQDKIWGGGKLNTHTVGMLAGIVSRCILSLDA